VHKPPVSRQKDLGIKASKRKIKTEYPEIKAQLQRGIELLSLATHMQWDTQHNAQISQASPAAVMAISSASATDFFGLPTTFTVATPDPFAGDLDSRWRGVSVEQI